MKELPPARAFGRAAAAAKRLRMGTRRAAAAEAAATENTTTEEEDESDAGAGRFVLLRAAASVGALPPPGDLMDVSRQQCPWNLEGHDASVVRSAAAAAARHPAAAAATKAKRASCNQQSAIATAALEALEAGEARGACATVAEESNSAPPSTLAERYGVPGASAAGAESVEPTYRRSEPSALLSRTAPLLRRLLSPVLSKEYEDERKGSTSPRRGSAKGPATPNAGGGGIRNCASGEWGRSGGSRRGVRRGKSDPSLLAAAAAEAAAKAAGASAGAGGGGGGISAVAHGVAFVGRHLELHELLSSCLSNQLTCVYGQKVSDSPLR